MRITRKQSVIASIAILVLFFISVALLRPSSVSLPEKTASDSTSTSATQASTSDQLPQNGSDFVLDDFKREEVKAGKKVWEVHASRGRYNPSAGQAALENAFLWLYQKDGGIVTLKADKAVLKLEGAEALSSAEFSGNVVIVQDGKTTLETDQASYDKAKDMITSPTLVKVKGDSMNLEGLGMEVIVSTKDIRLLKQTRTLLEQKDSATAVPTKTL